MSDELKVGDSVRLKARGVPQMTVTTVARTLIAARWIDRAGLHSDWFPRDAVKKARPRGPAPKAVRRRSGRH
jgi:uncharacterized protein YodC (DUF2158 family)